MSIEPTPENVAIAILAGGICPKCGGPPSTPIGWYCDACWEPIQNMKSASSEHAEWRRLTHAWTKALRKGLINEST